MPVRGAARAAIAIPRLSAGFGPILTMEPLIRMTKLLCRAHFHGTYTKLKQNCRTYPLGSGPQ
jgi:hypothetical protein